MNRLHSLLLVLAALVLTDGPGRACNVPVFRQALERWKQQFYTVHVFHKGPLGAAERKLVDGLAAPSVAEGGSANLDVSLIDLNNEPNEAMRELFAEQRSPVLPWVVVRATNVEREPATVWAGTLTEQVVGELLDSPVRREAVRRILTGETAVWILLECGDKEKDDAAARLLDAELKRLTPQLKLPVLTDAPDDQISAKGPPLRIAFSTLRLKRDDPAERFLVQMLLLSESDLSERKEPMAFTVFGRGNCLAAIVGRGITPENIRKGCSVMLAPCTCQLESELPRFDLLMNTDWNAVLDARPAPTAKETAIREGEPVTPPESVASPSPAATEEPSTQLVPRRLLIPAIVVAALLVLITGTWAVLSGRSRMR